MKKILLILLLNLFFSTSIALAQSVTNSGGTASACTSGVCTLGNPLSGVNTPQQLIGKIISAVLGIVGSIALVMFIYGGLTWMLAAGNAQAVEKGKNILVWATIGLVVIFSAYALVRFVLGDVLGAIT